MQLALPPFSQFQPALFLLLELGLTATFGCSLWLLLTTAPDRIRRLPYWLWLVLIVIVPVVAPAMFLLFGAPSSSARLRRAVALAAIGAVVVTVTVVAIQQIGIWNCRLAPGDPLTRVCELEPRSELVPVVSGVLAAILVGTATRRRRPGRSPHPAAA